MSKAMNEAAQLFNEYVSDHPGAALKEAQEYVMEQTGLQLDAVRRARKQSRVALVRKGKGWTCWLKDPEADVNFEGFVRMVEMIPAAEWKKLMKAFKERQVEIVIVPSGADVVVDGRRTM